MEIYNKLKSVPNEFLKTIQAGRLKGMSDIKPQWRIMKMTEVFGICGIGWKISNIQFKYTNGSDNQIVCSCYLELFIRVNNEWSDAIPGVGGSSFVANERSGLYTSDEAEKMAYTDAISVATKMIGLASDVYMGLGGKYDAPKQIDIEGAKAKLIVSGNLEQLKTNWNSLSKDEKTNKEIIDFTNTLKAKLK